MLVHHFLEYYARSNADFPCMTRQGETFTYAEVEQRWQRIDVVINNAGVATGDRIEQGEWSTWEWVIDINLKSVALGCRTFTPMMKKQGSGTSLIRHRWRA